MQRLEEYSNEVCNVYLDPNFVMVEWQGYATSGQFRQIAENVLTVLKSHGLKAILGDSRELPMISIPDQAWLQNDWLPRALAAGLRYSADIPSRYHFVRVAAEEIQSRIADQVVIRRFSDPLEASQWLREVVV